MEERTMRATKLTALAAAAIFSVSLAACGGNDSSGDSGAAAAPATTSAAPGMAPSSSSDMTMTDFGAGCAAVPSDPSNKGSFDAMAQVPVATAASGNPLL